MRIQTKLFMEIIYSKGFGSRELEQGLQMTPHSQIGIGSVNKSITAMGILKIVEAGKLLLKDSAARYFPVARFTTPPDIQIRHIFSPLFDL